ncbi:DUF1992 domain-containing protein [Bacillus carboniphilus]|uniref:DUF1992 domain-containing protein n=1 Tax=Bacillus carboniphilus TaxID=86663 RepID=A0ABP3GEV6_9BACI
MDRFFTIAEDHIKRAMREGEFDNLPGKGKPLPKDDLAHIPEELRMAYRIMKNAGYSEEENELKREVMSIEDLIRDCEDEEERKRHQTKLNEKLLRWNQMQAKKGSNTHSSLFKNYEHRIESKFASPKKTGEF